MFSLFNKRSTRYYALEILLLSLLLLSNTITGSSQLKLASPFSDNMVLQQNKLVRVWGKASPGAPISVVFDKVLKISRAKFDSSWAVLLPSFKSGGNPKQLTVYSGKDTIRISNLIFGDVWVCIGQSNMEWPLKKEMHYGELNQNIRLPLLRFYNPVYAGKNIFGLHFSDSVVKQLTIEKFYSGKWDTTSYSTLGNMSAVAYYFGVSIIEKTGVPIGLIQLSIGGAPLESFICKETMASNEKFAKKVNSSWLTNSALPVWARERGLQNVGDKPGVPGDELGPNHAFKPGFAFEAGITNLLNFPIAGIICYQGESNAQEWDRVAEYGHLSKLLVEDYRIKWKQPTLPFYYVQLSSIDSIRYRSQFWPVFRNEQRKMLSNIKHTGMAVCSDIGSPHDVHPSNKKIVGQRLARWALRNQYHQGILTSGPLPTKARYKNKRIIIHFRYTGKGLACSEGKILKGFTVNGVDSINATIQGKRRVIVYSGANPFIYYAWKPYSDGNLVNSENLPASTFKIEVQ